MVSFPVSCGAPEQESIDRGIALLNSFVFDEGQKQFEDAAQKDPSLWKRSQGVGWAHWCPLVPHVCPLHSHHCFLAGGLRVFLLLYGGRVND